MEGPTWVQTSSRVHPMVANKGCQATQGRAWRRSTFRGVAAVPRSRHGWRNRSVASILLDRRRAVRRDPQPDGPARSAPIACWAAGGRGGRRIGRWPNPSGGGTTARWPATRPRSVTSTRAVLHAVPSVTSDPSRSRRVGTRPAAITSAARTTASRRRIPRTAEGSSISGRSRSVATSRRAPPRPR
jgi:hypothetical protein